MSYIACKTITAYLPLQTLNCTNQGKLSKHSSAPIKENGSRSATPNIAPTTRNSSQRAQDLRNNSAHFPSRQNRSRHAFPNTTRMHLETLKCTDQGIRIKECNSKHCHRSTTRMNLQRLKYTGQGIRIKECNSKHCAYKGKQIKCSDQGIQIKECIFNTMLDSSCRSSKTRTPTETRTRGMVRSLPPHFSMQSSIPFH
jgi:hypothetical protein